ncbi:MAG: HAD hydrolase family protein [Candidatus Riflebacteria bacterium]|nr:HAD hydrolase family protein [Candidatus Riflebacteria bacterium]
MKAIALDVDGVLTDGTFHWGPGGEEWKSFSFFDVMGISLGIRAGLVFALISGEDSPLVDRFAAKMAIGDVYKGCKDKAAAFRSFCGTHGFDPAEVCFMGDDVNDLGAMALAGLAAAPASAHDQVKRQAHFITQKPGGRGAVRDLIDRILDVRSEAHPR